MRRIFSLTALLLFISFLSGCRITFSPTPAERKPAGIYHTVQKGETLWRIGRTYGLSVERLKKANNLSSDQIEVGQRLFIPGARSVKSVPALTPAPSKTVPAKPAPTIIVKPQLTGDQFKLPVAGKLVSPPDQKRLVFESRPNEPLRSVWSGSVFFVGETKDYPLTLIVKHSNGYYTIYGGDILVKVQKGETVAADSLIGQMSASKEKPLLYFELRRGVTLLDPRPYFPELR